MNETQAVIQTILSVQPQESKGGEAASSDEIALDLSKSVSLRIFERLNLEEIHPHLAKVHLNHLKKLFQSNVWCHIASLYIYNVNREMKKADCHPSLQFSFRKWSDLTDSYLLFIPL